jgi:DNA-binding transcriptional ArsR family regulator
MIRGKAAAGRIDSRRDPLQCGPRPVPNARSLRAAKPPRAEAKMTIPEAAALLGAAGHAVRLRILICLYFASSEVRPLDLGRLLRGKAARLAGHLAKLRSHGLAHARRSGSDTLYRLGDHPFTKTLPALWCLEHVTDAQRQATARMARP